MPVTTIRLDEEDLRYLDGIAERQSLDRTSLIKKAIKLGVSDILLEDALEKYKKGSCSAWECARQAQLTLWEFLEELRKREIYLRTDEIELEYALKELA
jgi:predicted HTH domain antitoxin